MKDVVTMTINIKSSQYIVSISGPETRSPEASLEAQPGGRCSAHPTHQQHSLSPECKSGVHGFLPCTCALLSLCTYSAKGRTQGFLAR